MDSNYNIQLPARWYSLTKYFIRHMHVYMISWVFTFHNSFHSFYSKNTKHPFELAAWKIKLHPFSSTDLYYIDIQFHQ